MSKNGILFLLSGPSGSGKSTILNNILLNFSNLATTISCTTRSPRKGELNEREYYFLSIDQFNEYIQSNKLAEYASVSGNMYGTLKSEIYDKINNGINVIIDIDYVGANLLKLLCIKKSIKCISIFLAVDSIFILQDRLKNRDSNTNKDISIRTKTAMVEFENMYSYDYIIDNNLDINSSSIALRDIIKKYII